VLLLLFWCKLRPPLPNRWAIYACLSTAFYVFVGKKLVGQHSTPPFFVQPPDSSVHRWYRQARSSNQVSNGVSTVALIAVCSTKKNKQHRESKRKNVVDFWRGKKATIYHVRCCVSRRRRLRREDDAGGTATLSCNIQCGAATRGTRQVHP
jgi:hypothetical protein